MRIRDKDIAFITEKAFEAFIKVFPKIKQSEDEITDYLRIGIQEACQELALNEEYLLDE